ncbi:MAG: hypothetical protein AAFN12_04265 [Cyanobacteria bacterium J06560_2]
MVSTFINPVVNPDQPLGLSPFTETAPIRHWPTQSTSDSASPTASTPAQQIEKLQGELMAARSLSAIAEFKLNKWRQRSY